MIKVAGCDLRIGAQRVPAPDLQGRADNSVDGEKVEIHGANRSSKRGAILVLASHRVKPRAGAPNRLISPRLYRTKRPLAGQRDAVAGSRQRPRGRSHNDL